MANKVKWSSVVSAAVTVMTTEMNSLANNTLSAASPIYDNTVLRDVFVDVELVLASLTPTTGGYVALYAAPSLDGTNYADVKREAVQHLMAVFVLDTSASAKRMVMRNVMLPPGLFKLYVDNQSGVSLGASGNTVKVVAYEPEVQ